MSVHPFADYRVLVLEDEPLISMLTEDMVTGLGGTVIGPFSRVATARAEVAGGAGHVSLALLDVNLNGERSTSFAGELKALGVPVVFCTGYDEAGIEEQWRSIPRLRKPFSEAELVETVAAAMASGADRDQERAGKHEADAEPVDRAQALAEE
jgi:CheY-like chemotaxis protein